MKRCLWLLLLLSLPLFAFDDGLSGLEVQVGEWRSEYRLMSFFVLPQQKLPISVFKGKKAIPFTLSGINEAPLSVLSTHNYIAPIAPGDYQLTVTTVDNQKVELRIFVMYPAARVKNGKLNGYTIGQYPRDPYKGLNIYQPPEGYVEVTPHNQDLWISPNYQLKQFLCKQAEGFPKYVVLQTRLLRKLEYLTKVAVDQGYATQGFVIMSGYRTPYYNKSIGNTKNSRHQWGGAADIYIDESPKDGTMDDLNKDGKIDVKDAQVLYDLVEGHFDVPGYRPMIGGLGIYRANAYRGPFIHVDVRGAKARW
ncbi:D-Ala-D-Ala carboxypeptidase family metallohydrolase [Aliiglaciecola sp. CAU 1673]|uniref:D-Ala-D-Ala carboxypeptidase family metallohydrolase n=1 Tax=Aliiglaciecola sp. CAU 1673 TaxID=3032595 RepID=UPI0023DAAE44|nr:D-Ala-D-Ala carboxypeptidase family metallohydrolase [Aliiglaciecola sp. CAU 1673]MDF2177619.1 D-Ala-D-Ala carboxypeptidase family metallohydrolase [Aliiglaciecola sp. CAU 1673]